MNIIAAIILITSISINLVLLFLIAILIAYDKGFLAGRMHQYLRFVQVSKYLKDDYELKKDE